MFLTGDHKSCFSLLKCMSSTPWFSLIFTKGNNFCDFLIASLDNAALCLKELTTNKMEGKNKNKSFASPESVPIHITARGKLGNVPIENKKKTLSKVQIQSTLVISTSVISNNRLSRRENLVLL